MKTRDPSLDLDDTAALTAGGSLWHKSWVLPLVLGVLAVVLLLPFDSVISESLRSLELGGDIKRELRFMQQYGQGTSVLIIALVIWTMDPLRRQHLLDLGAAMLVTGAGVQLLKMCTGRPRPSMGDPLGFIGPFGAYPLYDDHAPQAAWAFWLHGASKLWSFPSSHTAFAMVASVFLATLYPRLKWLAAGAVIIVGFGRLNSGAHYPSDVIVGAGIGYICTREAMRRQWGSRAAQRLMG